MCDDGTWFDIQRQAIDSGDKVTVIVDGTPVTIDTKAPPSDMTIARLAAARAERKLSKSY